MSRKRARHGKGVCRQAGIRDDNTLVIHNAHLKLICCVLNKYNNFLSNSKVDYRLPVINTVSLEKSPVCHTLPRLPFCSGAQPYPTTVSVKPSRPFFRQRMVINKKIIRASTAFCFSDWWMSWSSMNNSQPCVDGTRPSYRTKVLCKKKKQICF